jgi:hypothetical protein
MLYIAIVRYTRRIAVGAYVVPSFVWVAWILDQQIFFGQPTAGWIVLAILGLIQVLAGLLIGQWWALFLPFGVVFFAIPFGFPDPNRGEPFPVWFGVLFWTPAALALIALGVAATRLSRKP